MKKAADYLDWKEFELLTIKLEQNGDYRTCLLAVLSTFFALRIGDTLNLKWSDIIEISGEVKESFILHENKNAKRKLKKREIFINDTVSKIITRIKNKMNVNNLNTLIFIQNKTHKAITARYVNILLKKIKEDKERYSISISAFSSHTFRKTFGRKVWEQSGKTHESLLHLQKVFGHSDIETTKIYLGITKEEINEVYKSLKF